MPDGDYKRTVRTGNPLSLPAAMVNRWQATADQVEGRQKTGGGPPVTGDFKPDVVQVRNTTSTAFRRGGVIGLATLTILPTDAKPIPQIYFTAIAPTAYETNSRRLAILAAPLAPQQTTSGGAATGGGPLVSAYVGGIFPARINFPYNSDDWRYARVNLSDAMDGMDNTGPTAATILEASEHDGEYEIVWHGDQNVGTSGTSGEGSDVRWAIVRPRPIGLPRPTAPYQVYTPLDDTLQPVWTYPRWS